MKNKVNATSLFSSAGIGTLYTNEVGVNVCVSNELLQKRVEIHQFLYPNCHSVVGDINDSKVFDELLKLHQQNNCQILFATPPCQGMSLAGKRRVDDKRNLLIVKVVEFIKITKPKLIIIENVIQMYSTNILVNNQTINIKDYLKQELQDIYEYIDFYKINTKDFEVAQDRKRAIVIISNKKIDLPKKSKELTVFDAISHLPSLESNQSSDILYHHAPKHNERHIWWLKNTPTGKSAHHNIKHYPSKANGERIKGYSTTYKRIAWDKPAPTITMANGSISSQNNVHPGRLLDNGLYSDARVLSIKEIFLLTGLKDDFQLPSNIRDTTIRHIIGECVPPNVFKKILENNIDKIKD